MSDLKGKSLSSFLCASTPKDSSEYLTALEKFRALSTPLELPSLECPIVQSLEESFRREIDGLQVELDAAKGKKEKEE